MLESMQESAPRASRLEHRTHQGRSQTGPGPAGANGGVAGAERAACSGSVIPSGRALDIHG